MLIGQLSKETGFSRDTIRYYEKLGLIGEAGRAGHFTNYKNYPQSTLKRLIAIRKIKEYGFTLKEMQGLFILFEEGALQHERGLRYVKRKISVIDGKINELKIVKNRLREITNAGNAGKCPLDKSLKK